MLYKVLKKWIKKNAAKLVEGDAHCTVSILVPAQICRQVPLQNISMAWSLLLQKLDCNCYIVINAILWINLKHENNSCPFWLIEGIVPRVRATENINLVTDSNLFHKWSFSNTKTVYNLLGVSWFFCVLYQNASDFSLFHPNMLKSFLCLIN